MTLKIVRSTEDGVVMFSLSGRIEPEHVGELQNLVDFAAARNSVVLDLNEVRLVDRQAVQFLARCETEGVELDNCPPYIREWIEKERSH